MQKEEKTNVLSEREREKDEKLHVKPWEKGTEWERKKKERKWARMCLIWHPERENREIKDKRLMVIAKVNCNDNFEEERK